MDKPSWIDEVKEITFEEAELMHSLGVDVGGDYGPPFGGDDGTSWSQVPVYSSVITSWWYMVLEHKRAGIRPVVFYVRKDEEQIL